MKPIIITKMVRNSFKRSPPYKYISISFKTESRGYTIKKHLAIIRKAEKTG